MKTTRRNHLNALLESALDLPAAERGAYAVAACDDPSLLDALMVLLRLEEDAADWLPDPSIWARPERLGPYRILGLLGEGGMGAVYRAIRDDGTFEQEVAIKLIRPGMMRPENLRRFQAERQILADLKHPNIARLLDGGTEKGAPYLVMEQIEGKHVDCYADAKKLSIAQRIDLFRTICEAVEEAHRNLVVHRDLKPANILVTEAGIPKLLDFGIAFLANADSMTLTAKGQRPMSPRYASPEQIRGERITTAGDIYSLGVILYELLTGCQPYMEEIHDLASLERAIHIANLPAPAARVRGLKRDKADVIASYRGCSFSQLVASLNGDLGAIVLKTLERDPADRYASVRALREDLERFRKGQPVQARRQTRFYLLRRFLKRHRWASAATTVALTALLTFTYVTVLQRDQLIHQKDRLQVAQEKSQSVLDFMLEMFALGDPATGMTPQMGIKELLKEGERNALRGQADHPEVRLAILNTIAKVYTTLGLLDDAERLLTVAEDTVSGMKPNSTEVLGSQIARGRLAFWRGKTNESVRLLGDAVNGFGPEHSNFQRAEAYYLLASSTLEVANYKEVSRHVVAAERLLVGMTSKAAMKLRVELGILEGLKHFYLGQFRESLNKLQQMETLVKDNWKQGHPLLGEISFLSAQNNFSRGHIERAQTLTEQSLANDQTFWGEDHYYTAESLNFLGVIHLAKSDFEKAEAYLYKAERIYQESLGSHHLRTAHVYHNLSMLYKNKGRLYLAETFNRKALKIRERNYGAKHPYTLQVHIVASQIKAQLWRLEEALEHVDKAIEGTSEIDGAWAALAQYSMQRAHILILFKRGEEAMKEAETSVAYFEAHSPDHFNYPKALYYAGQAALQLNHHPRALSFLEQARTLSVPIHGPQGLTLKIDVEMIVTLLGLGNLNRAEEILSQCLPRLYDVPPDATTTKAQFALAELMARQGCLNEARTLFEQQSAILERLEMDTPWSQAFLERKTFFDHLSKAVPQRGTAPAKN